MTVVAKDLDLQLRLRGRLHVLPERVDPRRCQLAQRLHAREVRAHPLLVVAARPHAPGAPRRLVARRALQVRHQHLAVEVLFQAQLDVPRRVNGRQRVVLPGDGPVHGEVEEGRQRLVVLVVDAQHRQPVVLGRPARLAGTCPAA